MRLLIRSISVTTVALFGNLTVAHGYLANGSNFDHEQWHLNIQPQLLLSKPKEKSFYFTTVEETNAEAVKYASINTDNLATEKNREPASLKRNNTIVVDPDDNLQLISVTIVPTKRPAFTPPTPLKKKLKVATFRSSKLIKKRSKNKYKIVATESKKTTRKLKAGYIWSAGAFR